MAHTLLYIKTNFLKDARLKLPWKVRTILKQVQPLQIISKSFLEIEVFYGYTFTNMPCIPAFISFHL